MTTLDQANGAFRSVPVGVRSPGSRTSSSQRSSPPVADEVDSDMASLALHMDHCAQAQCRPSRMRRLAGLAHALASPRVVTMAAVAGLMAVAVVSLGLSIAQVI